MNDVQGAVHISSLFDESVAMCGARDGALLRIGWETTPREERCQACRDSMLEIAANLQAIAADLQNMAAERGEEAP
jgi:hypothetical protein